MPPLKFFPNVIFFDAVGTLFGVKGSVGEIYGAIARKYNVNACDQALNQAFIQNFTTAPKIAFPQVSPLEIPNYEYAWWYDIAKLTFSQVGAFEQFKDQDFDLYFEEMFKFFATPEAWYIYDDVIPNLEHIQKLNEKLNQKSNQDQSEKPKIELGIISNFDSRIHHVLENLGLAKYFASVTISTEVGAAKPDSLIFEAAIAKHLKSNSSNNSKVQTFWHVGDSLKEDYEGARKSDTKGNILRGIWIDRSGSSMSEVKSIASFNDLKYLIEV